MTLFKNDINYSSSNPSPTEPSQKHSSHQKHEHQPFYPTRNNVICNLATSQTFKTTRTLISITHCIHHPSQLTRRQNMDIKMIQNTHSHTLQTSTITTMTHHYLLNSTSFSSKNNLSRCASYAVACGTIVFERCM